MTTRKDNYLPRNPYDRLLDIAAGEARNIASAPALTPYVSPTAITTDDVDEDGNVYTIRPMFWGDLWGDPATVWTKD